MQSPVVSCSSAVRVQLQLCQLQRSDEYAELDTAAGTRTLQVAGRGENLEHRESRAWRVKPVQLWYNWPQEHYYCTPVDTPLLYLPPLPPAKHNQ